MRRWFSRNGGSESRSPRCSRRLAVGGEAGAVRGDLEEDVARDAEIQRLEVEAVHQPGVAYPVLSKMLLPTALFVHVAHPARRRGGRRPRRRSHARGSQSDATARPDRRGRSRRGWRPPRARGNRARPSGSAQSARRPEPPASPRRAPGPINPPARRSAPGFPPPRRMGPRATGGAAPRNPGTAGWPERSPSRVRSRRGAPCFRRTRPSQRLSAPGPPVTRRAVSVTAPAPCRAGADWGHSKKVRSVPGLPASSA